MSLEKCLIDHCSPTLAGLKTANLFTIKSDSKKKIIHQIKNFNIKFSSKSISLILFRYVNNTALIYICRKSKLQTDLKNSEVIDFLSCYGYDNLNVNFAIKKLISRVSSDNFPHEIGVFLGYPISDVKGFIENSGKNFQCCGCWKVYSNKNECIKEFNKYKKCKEVYTRQWQQGKSLMKLTVAS